LCSVLALSRALAAAAAWLAASAALAEPLAIVGATVIDGTGAAPVAGATVIVAGERIAAVGPAGQVPVPEGARTLDGRGLWLIPGLIDAHVHLANSASLYSNPVSLDLRAVRAYESDELERTRAALPATLLRYLASGVTSVIDRGGPSWTLDLRALAESAPAPRIVLSGPMLATYRAPVDLGALATTRWIRSPEEARAAVRANARAGVDQIKIHFLPRPGRLADDLAWAAAAIAEAHAHGLPVAVHATQQALARAVVEAGADQLVHSIDNAIVDDAFAGLLVEHGTVLTTTLLVFEGYREVFLTGLDYSDIELRLGDPRVIATLDDLARIDDRHLPIWLRAGRSARGGQAGAATLWPYWATRDVRRIEDANLRKLAAAGVVIAAGTDAGTIGNLHGPALQRELELMANAGLEPLSVIRAATMGGAAAMGRADELGSIEAGKLADMVLLEADPLADIRNARRIRAVIKGGVVYDATELEAMIAQATP
jgi:imidazolonepropionase-like amidohydrolase